MDYYKAIFFDAFEPGQIVYLEEATSGRTEMYFLKDCPEFQDNPFLLFVFLMNSVLFGLLFFLLGHYFELEIQVWNYFIMAVLYGLMAVFLRPKMISFLTKLV